MAGPFDLSNYGATGDRGDDASDALEAALRDASVAGGVVEVGAGCFRVTRPLKIPGRSASANPSGRTGGTAIRGANMYHSVILSEVDGYTFTGNAEALSVSDLCVKTTTAGGFDLGQGGSVSFERFFMDGCGAGYWGIHSLVPYPISIDSCRFWNAGTGYQGGAWYLEGAIAPNLRANFVSMMQKDGDITVYKNCYSINHQSGMYESRALGSGAFANQSLISLQGTNQAGYLDGIYTETQANRIIDVAGGTSARGMRVGSVFAFQRDDNGRGDPNFQVIRCPSTALSTRLAVDSIVLQAQPTATGGYVIEDPGNSVDVRSFRNTSSGNQASRALKAA